MRNRCLTVSWTTRYAVTAAAVNLAVTAAQRSMSNHDSPIQRIAIHLRPAPDYLRRVWQELKRPRDPLTWAQAIAWLTDTPRRLPHSWIGRIGMVVVGIAILVAVFQLYSAEGRPAVINPIVGGLGALFLIYAAIRQARTASRQAQIAADRHEAQTKADLQRRFTETFSKAVEQLGSEKIEVRVGGIYTLERLALEALAGPDEMGADLYSTVMETLTAFVRERAKLQEPKPAAGGMADKADYLWPTEKRPGSRPDEIARPEPATDIAAVLAVLRRRPDSGLVREAEQACGLDLRATDLRGANLVEVYLERALLARAHLDGAELSAAHLEGAHLASAHLQCAYLEGAHLKHAYLRGAHLDGARLQEAHLEHADLWGAHLEGANLKWAHLEGAGLAWAHLEDADLYGAHLEGAYLRAAHLDGVQNLVQSIGDAHTRLPEGVWRPVHWPPEAPDSDSTAAVAVPCPPNLEPFLPE
jgi:hypothetical protein